MRSFIFTKKVTICFSVLFFSWLSAHANLRVLSEPMQEAPATCEINQARYPCSVGKGGIRLDKKEDDGATPVGSFPIREIFYRVDKLTQDELARLKRIQAKGFVVKALTPNDIWIDDSSSSNYNQFAQLSMLKNKNISYENLWRDDDVYDIIVVIGYNDHPVIKKKGSAIFMHVVRLSTVGKYMPTVGCIALSKPDLLKILAAMAPGAEIEVRSSI